MKQWFFIQLFFFCFFCGLSLWPRLGVSNSSPKKKAFFQKGSFLSKQKKCGSLCRQKLYRMKVSKINRLLSRLHQLMTYHERLAMLSQMYLGGTYRYGPLGEGPSGRFDRDPIFRLDQVDCVTYVETIMALALSHSIKEARTRLQQIRYKKGIVRYDHRNHFTAPQWLVENHKEGYIELITRKIAGSYIQRLQKKINRETWKGSKWIRRIPYPLLPKSYVVWFVPLKKVAKVIHQLPSIGWMGEVVQEPFDAYSILHVGFFVKLYGKYYFRHANTGGVRQRLLLSHTRRRIRRKKVVGYIFARFLPPNTKKKSL